MRHCNKAKIAVSSMTNADSFIREGAEAALLKLKTLGCEAVEVSQHIQFDEASIRAFLSCRESLGMEVCALSARYEGSIPWEIGNLMHGDMVLKAYSLEKDFNTLVSICHQCDCHYIRFATLPGRQMFTKEDVITYMEGLEETCLRYEKEGIHICVHNHADEFLRIQGKWILDWALELAPHLFYELDALNALRCGIDPVSLIKHLGGRLKLMHLQDLRIAPAKASQPVLMGPELYQGCALGDGNLDLGRICQAAVEAGCEYLIIEQAAFYGEDPYVCIEKSIKTLKNIVKQSVKKNHKGDMKSEKRN